MTTYSSAGATGTDTRSLLYSIVIVKQIIEVEFLVELSVLGSPELENKVGV